MSQTSPILSLPFLQPSQAQKHVTHNESLETLDVVVQLRVQSFDITTPPAAPVEGDVHVPAPGATGDWAGHQDDIAVWRDGQWHFVTPRTGWRGWDLTAARVRVWTGTAWDFVVAATDDLPGIGIGTSADASNVLAVRGPASLLTNDGAGHQLKINKNAAGDTASLLFQSNWTGHAEMGLAGNTDFSVKVSDDGSSWTTALVLDAATGWAGFGNSNPAARVHARETTDQTVLRAENTDAGFSGAVLEVDTDRVGDSGFDLARFASNGQADTEFAFSGDGNGSCDGSWSGGGADYAEFFEWVDGNPDAEDRRGLSVVLVGAKIRPAEPGDMPIGVISGNPSVIGDADIGRWKGKYLSDEFASPLREPFEVVEWNDADGMHSYAVDAVPDGIAVPAAARRRTGMRRVLNPDYVPGSDYVPRAQRAEWAVVGLMGKLRLRKGQPTGPRWTRMRDVSGEVEEWLVR